LENGERGSRGRGWGEAWYSILVKEGRRRILVHSHRGRDIEVKKTKEGAAFHQ
jgi:hypothetical protein